MLNYLYTLESIQVFPDRFSPTTEIKYVGETVQFKCHLPYQAEWKFEGKPLPAELASFHNNTNFLEIVDLNKNNSGVYSCFGTDGESYFESEGELIVVGKYLLLRLYTIQKKSCCTIIHLATQVIYYYYFFKEYVLCRILS